MLDNLQFIPGEAFTATGSFLEKVLDKISGATGFIAIPKGNKKYQLEAESYLIEQIKKDDEMPPLAKAASISRARKLIREYNNQNDILEIASEFIGEHSHPEAVDDDWLDSFFDRAKNVSREDMKIIWGKVLAGEINTPGSVSKSLIHILSIIDYESAHSFQSVIKFSLLINDHMRVALFTRKYPEVYEKYGLRESQLINLETLGLINLDMFIGYVLKGEAERVYNVSYHDFNVLVKVKAKEDFGIGNAMLSKAGEQLADLLGVTEEIPEFKEMLEKQFKQGVNEKDAYTQNISGGNEESV